MRVEARARRVAEHIAIAGLQRDQIALRPHVRGDDAPRARRDRLRDERPADVFVQRGAGAPRDRGQPPDVVQRRGEDQFVVGAGRAREMGGLQRVRQLVDGLVAVSAVRGFIEDARRRLASWSINSCAFPSGDSVSTPWSNPHGEGSLIVS
ncbi:hypothetical protein [Vulcanimicrobium alpinum]|uniref:hypothetical protein n=1 Tax=Vulcanimicrobium alpinum TaxID=3016050 RepID=UPI00295E2F59|nr:hypothetical protein [Vulcanimicrobium alpinum]